MNMGEFRYLADMVKKRSGITLTDDKSYLIESRLTPIARGRGLQDISQLCAKVRTSPTEDLLVEITEAMTTNESSFFRDIKPYEQLRQVILPQLMQSLGMTKSLRIWSAACSTGQEPYSVAMCLQEDAAKMPGWRFDIVATDIANKVVEKAKLGTYSQFEAQRGLPIQMLVKYFSSLPDTSWQLKDTIRSMVQFKTLNLLEDYASVGRPDLVFCRNVLIYFDDATKAQITEKMSRAIQPHGILVIGSTETLVDPTGLFVPMADLRGAYKKK